MNTFFVSDTHFGHINILKYESGHRQFASIEEHDETLVNNWNMVIGPEDIVYHLGDVIFYRRNEPVLERLNGRKHLILGNHDVGIAKSMFRKYFLTVDNECTIQIGEYKIWLCHYPFPDIKKRQCPRDVHLHIHGHTHSRDPAFEHDQRTGVLRICVSLEQTNMMPISYDDLLTKVGL